MSWTETTHSDAEALAAVLADALAQAIRDGLVSRGRAVLALAGGRTPFPVYRRLAETPLDWSRVVLLATDERWVDVEHSASNSREIVAAFAAARGVRVLPLVPAGPGPEANAAFATSIIRPLAEPFDAVLLGMGSDGHFASLFPGAAELAAGLQEGGPDDVLVVHPNPLPPEAPFDRISLTMPALLASDALLFVIRGEEKRAIFEQALVGKHDFPVARLLGAAKQPVICFT